MNARNVLLAALFGLGSVILVHLAAYYQWFEISAQPLTVLRWCTVALFTGYAILNRSLTTWILVSMLIGLEIGLDVGKPAKDLNVLSTIFIRLIKTVVGPLLFSTLVIGIAGQSNSQKMGRIALKSFAYFLTATSVALLVGLVAINYTRAGAGLAPPSTQDTKIMPASELLAKVNPGKKEAQILLPDSATVKVLEPNFKLTWQYTTIHTFPENVAKMIYEGAVLQVVIFSLIFGFSLRQVEEKHRKVMLDWCETLSEVMFKFVGIIMYFAPFAVGGALAATVGEKGIAVMINLGKLLGTLYIALFAFILLVFVPVMLFFRIPMKKFFNAIYPPASLAFATASSEAALPQAMKAMEKFGVPRNIVSFVLPTGYSFNLDGSTLYLALASMFCVQAAGPEVEKLFPWEMQLVMMGTLLLTSKGVAAVPRASLVILAATVAQFNIPEWPIAIILGVDALMDMGRTCVNLVGNCLASAVVARWEGELTDGEG